MKAGHAAALLLVGLLISASSAESQPLSTQWLNNVHSGNPQIRRHRRLLSTPGAGGPSTVPLMLPNVKLAMLRQGGTPSSHSPLPSPPLPSPFYPSPLHPPPPPHSLPAVRLPLLLLLLPLHNGCLCGPNGTTMLAKFHYHKDFCPFHFLCRASIPCRLV